MRDHAQQMLIVICADLDTYQGVQDSIEKSHGNAPAASSETAAETHAAERLASGLTIEELMAEYRALRASVLRLWQIRVDGADALAVQDMLRFNEAIDQTLTESVCRYSQMTREAQNVFLAILGHDVRTPLGAIGMSAQLLLLDKNLSPDHVSAANRIAGSTKRVTEIVNALIDFAISNLGQRMTMRPESMDLSAACEEVIDEFRVVYPEREIKLVLAGDLTVCWDRARVEQALSNLVANAIQHGAKDEPILVTVKGESAISISIQNMGEAISPVRLRTLFDPTKQFARQGQNGEIGNGTEHLGLGLYITRDIVGALGGTIDVSSSNEKGTTFTVILPRESNGAR